MKDREGKQLQKRGSREFAYAFPKTVPVMVGYLVLGMAYGILMKVQGYGIWWSFAMSLFVYAGSLQYAGIAFLTAGVHPLYALLMAVMINARHIFYGISMLEKYKDMGIGKPYLIFGLTDETFSVVCNEQVPEGLNRERVFLWITLLDQSYWVAGSVLGAVLGGLITFNTAGMDFALTALFVVIFVEQWESNRDHRPAVIGVGATAVCLRIFGTQSFLIPAMAVIFIVIFLVDRTERKGVVQA